MLTLNEGEIYYEEMSNKNTYISLYKEGENHNNIYIQVNRKTFNKRGAGVKLENVKRLATDEEKAWLEHCIKEDKFVEYEEFMKIYKPQFIVGQWYKIELSHTYNHFIKFKSFDNINGYIDNLGYIKDLNKFATGNSLTLKSITKYELLTDLSEIQKFLPLDHPDKQLDIKQIQEECKRRFPIGCKYISANSIKKQYILIQDETVYEINDSYIYASDNQGCLYYEGKYAELIEAPEVISPEYVECVIEDSCIEVGKIYQVDKNLGFKYADDIKPVYYLVENYRTPYYQSHFRPSTKLAYDLQNLKQQPLTLEQCYNTEIEVGDEVECVEGIGHPGIGFNLGLKFIVNDIQNYKPEKCYFGGDRGHGVYENHLKLIKKANKNTTTTTLNKKVDVSSPKVTDKITVPKINTTSYDTLVHINIETNTKSIKIPKLETNTPEIKKIKIQSLTLTI